MARIPNLKLSEDEVSQSIDLEKYLGKGGASNPAISQAFAQAVIDRIISRTESGRDAFGSQFKGYSKSYKDSLAFKAFGKSSRVNLELTGEMLSSVDILSISRGNLTIGITGEPAARAYGHMTGMEGHPFLDGVTPERKFFGVTEQDLEDIAKDFEPELESTAEDERLIEAIQQAVERRDEIRIATITNLEDLTGVFDDQ